MFPSFIIAQGKKEKKEKVYLTSWKTFAAPPVDAFCNASYQDGRSWIQEKLVLLTSVLEQDPPCVDGGGGGGGERLCKIPPI